jgi:hypothetical protein
MVGRWPSSTARELTPACGIWKVIKLDLDLVSKVPQENGF